MMDPVQQALLRYGTAQQEVPARLLRAGQLTAQFADGALRDIRYDGVEIIRAIAYLVRDANWGTIAPRIAGLQIAEQDGGFQIRYEGRCEGADGQCLAYAAAISADVHGHLRFTARYHALSDFITCRNGFCVLHPIALAGQPVAVTHGSRSIEQAVFPERIAPWQPFHDIRQLTHGAGPGVTVTCGFEGDVFEMEDQRNWSDASYKTYVRPLALPWPYALARGEQGEQAIDVRVTVKSEARLASPDAIEPEVVMLSLARTDIALPGIGLLVTPDDTDAMLAHLGELRAIAPQHLLCHFDPAAGHGMHALRDYAALAQRYPASYTLECVVPGVAAPGEELAVIAAQLAAAGFHPDSVAVSPAVDRQSVPPGSPWPACPPLDDIYRAARAAFPDAAIGGGMFSYFTELNRKRPPLGRIDWVTHATNPIVHAADDHSVMQTLVVLPHITGSCRAIIGATPYRIGPVTLAMRQNPYGSQTVDNPDDLRIPMANSDPRSRAQFGAAWLLGYAAQVAPAGIAVLTLGPLTGPRGLLGSGPAADTAGHKRYPAFHIVAALAALAGRKLVAATSFAPDRVVALGATDEDGLHTVWLANLTPQTQRCRIVDLAAPKGIEVAHLDERHSGLSAWQPAHAIGLELLPYACLCVRWRA